MPKPSMAELLALEGIAAAIVQDFIGTPQKRGVPRDEDYAKGIVGDIKIKAGVADDRFPNVESIHAASGTAGIQVNLPTNEWWRAVNDTAGRARVCRVTAAVLAHEFTHALQRRADKLSYCEAARKRKEFEAKPETDKTADQWLTAYYSIPEEREAHAIHAAAEVWLLQKGLSEEAFATEFAATEVYRRIKERVGGPDDGADAARKWWGEMRAMAWATYQNW